MPPHIAKALRISCLAMIGTLVYEVTKQIVFHGISIWESHILTILFLTASTFLVSIIMLRWEEESRSVLLNEIERRRKVETALRESEQRYRKLFASNPHPMWVFDVETLAFLEVNDATVAHYGYSREEFLKMTVKDIRPPEDVPGVLAALSGAECGYQISGGSRHRKKDGTVMYVDIAAYRFMQHGKLVSLILANDLTEHMRAEEAVRRSEAELRSFVDKSPFGIFRSSIEEDRFLDVNPALVKMLGYASADELLSTRLTEDIYINPQERRKTLTPLLRDGVNGVEIQCKRKSGEPVTFHLSGRLVQESGTGRRFLEGIAEDVTERKQAEVEIKRQAEFLQLMLDAMPYPVFYKDRQGRYLGCNRAFEQFYGILRGQITGKTVYEVAPKELADVYARADEELFTQTGKQIYEGRVQCTDGVRHDVIFQKGTFEGPDGQLAGLVGVVIDITERKREEEKRRALEQQLLQAQKMEAVGRLAGGIAHDFNNLLMVIQSYTEMLQDSLPAHNPLRTNTQQIMKAAERAVSLTGQMLAFSRKQISAPVVLDLNAVIDETAKMLMRLIGEDIEFRVHSAESLWATEADPDQIV
jgi:two-component system, cell cycle sensor histidine kinase and response regulator CckA